MKFTSKAQTLKFLSKYRDLRVPKLIIFKAINYKKDQKKILKIISDSFNKNIAIRSSNVLEDKNQNTKAGMFKSFLNIDPKNKIKTNDAINKVIKSYSSFFDKKNEFFIQEMAQNVKLSGVCFTRNIDNNFPQWKINYTKNQDTTLVTSGTSLVNSINFLDSKQTKFKNNLIKKLYLKIKKIQKILNFYDLDIEFIINKNDQINIVQARKLPKSINNFGKKLDPKKIYKKIEKKIIKLKKNNSNLLGKTTYFATMPDWNPAEMIGIKPKPLALSLYKELITDSIWGKSRGHFGYRDLSDFKLLNVFYGKPFIDLRTDLNSWIPGNLHNSLATKLINFYLDEFKKNTSLHDKIEFEIVFTCFNFSTKKKLNKLLYKRFNTKEISQIKNSLININKFSFENINNEIALVEKLKLKQKEVENKDLYFVDKVALHIQSCKNFGTFAFSNLARSAFISIDILNSMVEEKILSVEKKNSFLNRIETISSKINFASTKNKSNFLKTYGHLRPDSYEITSPNYKEGYDLYFHEKSKFKRKNKNSFILTSNEKKNINKFLKKNNFEFNYKDLFSYMEKSIKQREYSKFIFTKSIDLIFENLKKIGKRNNIKIENLSFLNIQDIINIYNNLVYEDLGSLLKKKIEYNKSNYRSLYDLDLPEVILDKNDLYYFEETKTKVNFIGNQSISGKVCYLKEMKKNTNLKSKIVCIENADPGYDFIFSNDIKGLITKFGGSNSHMAIRCYEMGVPAAIGVGSQLFEKVKNKNFISMDCDTQKIF
jgi:phosphohistidine swiveling domain-containing protein